MRGRCAAVSTLIAVISFVLFAFAPKVASAGITIRPVRQLRRGPPTNAQAVEQKLLSDTADLRKHLAEQEKTFREAKQAELEKKRKQRLEATTKQLKQLSSNDRTNKLRTLGLKADEFDFTRKLDAAAGAVAAAEEKQELQTAIKDFHDRTILPQLAAHIDPAAKAKLVAAGLTEEDIHTAVLTGVAPPIPSALPPALVSAAGASWQTAAISGLAQFMSQRASEEVALWLADEIGKTICSKTDGSFATAKALLPETCALVAPDDASKKQDIATLGSLLAAALRHDFDALPVNVLAQFVSLTEPTKEALSSVLEQLRDGVAPIPLLTGLGEDPALQSDCTAHGGGSCWLVLIGTVVGDMGSVVDAPNPAAAAAAIDALVKQGPDLVAALPECSASCQAWVVAVKNDTKKADAFAATLRALIVDAKDFYDTIEQWKRSPPQDASAALMRASSALVLVTTILDDGFAVGVGPFPSLAVIQEKWTQARPLITALEEALKGAYADAVRDVLAFLGTDTAIRLPPDLVKYISFAVDLTQAKNATDVQALLDSAAAPVGSWRLKRQKTFTVSITGMVGVTGGLEMPLALHNQAGTISYPAVNGSAGLLGALGVDFSIHFDQSTVGLYLSALDVGQLLSVPFGNGSKDTNSTASAGGDLSFVQVLSPGAYLRFGIGNSPFVFGVGVAGAPSLRKFEYNDNSGSDQVSVIRIQAFLAVDLTLFPIASSAN